MDYTLNPSNRGLLNGEDLLFFYYDVFAKKEDSITDIYDWDSEIDDFITSQGMVIDECDVSQMPNDYPENTLLFTNSVKGETKLQAFFRHVRNAFSHMNIQRNGDYYLLRDYGCAGKISMIGKIKCDCFKNFCFLFTEQGENVIEKQSLTNLDTYNESN